MNRIGRVLPIAALAGLALPALAHNAICDCFFDEDDPNSVICEGGFSDGATAAGIPVRIVDREGKVLIEGAMDDMSEFVFTKPDVDFKVEFDAGEGHVIQIDGRDIE
jgi:hypothetical protein